MNLDTLADALNAIQLDNMPGQQQQQAQQQQAQQQQQPPVYQHPYTRSSITHAEISTIPNFNGDPNTLSLYIDACEDLLRTYADVHNNANPINAYLIKIAKSRITGEAQALIGSRKLHTWHEIKTLLELSFLDQRSEDCLLNDLTVEGPRKHENPYSFGQRIKSILNLLLTKMQTVTEADMIPLKTSLYMTSALQTYKRGLMKYGNLGELMYLKDPKTMEQAMSEVLEYQNWQYRCGKSSAPQQQIRTPHQITPGHMRLPSTNNLPQTSYKPQFPNQQFSPQQFSPQQFPQKQFPNQQFQRTQYPHPQLQYRSPPYQSYHRNQPNQFPQLQYPVPKQNQQNYPRQKPPSFKFNKSPGQLAEKRQPRQKPMDVDTSTFGRVRMTPFGPSYPQNKWAAEELHVQEEEEEYEEYEEEEYQQWDNPNPEAYVWEPQEEEEDNENFPEIASTSKKT